MNDPGHYPPPDFGSPAPNSIQPFQRQQQQQQSRTSGFHASMWSWSDTPSEPSWDYGGQAGWSNGAAAGYGFNSMRGHYGHQHPYGELQITVDV